MSNSPQAFGQVVHIGPIEQVSEKFRKRIIVLKTDMNSPYPQEVAFQLSQDKCDIIEKYGIKPDQIVTISYNLRGRRWEAKDKPVTWFNTLDAWKIEAQQQSGTTGQPEPATPQQKEVEGDLPF